MRWEDKHQEIESTWVVSMRNKTGIKDLFAFFDKEFNYYAVGVWNKPHADFSMVDTFGDNHPDTFGTPKPTADQVAQRASFTQDILKRTEQALREKKDRERAEAQRIADERKAAAKHLKRKGLDQTADMLASGQLPYLPSDDG